MQNLKAIFSQKPVLSTVLMNILSMLIGIFALYHGFILIVIPLTIVCLINRFILLNLEDNDNYDKMIILGSAFIMLAVFFTYAIYKTATH